MVIDKIHYSRKKMWGIRLSHMLQKCHAPWSRDNFFQVSADKAGLNVTAGASGAKALGDRLAFG
jgi:hypothetical protein